MIFGDGGVSKSVKYILEKNNISYIQVSRNFKKNMINYNDINKYIKSCKLIINCTTIGMYPNINDKININYNSINENNFVFDLIYNPKKTVLLKECFKRGAKIKNGSEMLKIQALRSFQIWTNKKL